MDHQKCRICGLRHPLGPCPHIEVVRQIAQDHKERVVKAAIVGRARHNAFIAEAQGDDVPWLAPKDQCASCDKRRTQLQATMKKRRAKTATVSRGSDTVS